jgi:hypothetical protein
LFTCGATHSARAAADAFTSPRGIYTVKAAGKPAGQSQARTYFGVQLLPDTKFYGVVSAVSGDAISFNGNSSYQGLADLERTSYAHVITGNGRGFIVDIAEFRQADIRCAQNLSGWITPGTQVSIRPHPHLADMFGADNRFGLGSGLYADSADNVVAWDAQTQQERVYYFHSTRARWEEKDIEADASRAIMRFPYGLYIVRRTPGTLRIALSGESAANPLLLPVRTGANVSLASSADHFIIRRGRIPAAGARWAKAATTALPWIFYRLWSYAGMALPVTFVRKVVWFPVRYLRCCHPTPSLGNCRFTAIFRFLLILGLN